MNINEEHLGIIVFVSSKGRRLEAQNFAVIFIFIPFTTYEKISFTEQAGRTFRNGFSARKVLGTFEKRAPDHCNAQSRPEFSWVLFITG